MVKKKLVEELAEKLDIPTSKARQISDTFLNIILDELKNSGKVVISGFGTFMVRERKQRYGRNPSTNERILLPSVKNVVFRVAKKTKQEL